jgi:hypothetical protein
MRRNHLRTWAVSTRWRLRLGDADLDWLNNCSV